MFMLDRCPTRDRLLDLEHFEQRMLAVWLEKVAARRSANQIHYLMVNEDERIDDLEEVKLHCVDYFKELFGSAPRMLTNSDKARITQLTKYRCTDAVKRDLMMVVTPEDVKHEVLNFKLIWLLFSTNRSLWVAWIKEHKLKRTTFWSTEPKPTDSWVWRFLQSLKLVAKTLITCKVNDGHTATRCGKPFSLMTGLLQEGSGPGMNKLVRYRTYLEILMSSTELGAAMYSTGAMLHKFPQNSPRRKLGKY
ncbi:unnamed protein product [Arabis nemorensis]|uniref:Uncharacterized protein n=1 Tax=Arabis nemorensis TaxID=586526 RepID=A0A565BGL0_9BRAS|nr:unnamed protein product [Arabis nemorensis]